MNTPNGTIDLGPGTANDPPISTQSPSYQFTYNNFNDFENSMLNGSGPSSCIPAPGLKTQASAGSGAYDTSWGDYVRKLVDLQESGDFPSDTYGLIYDPSHSTNNIEQFKIYQNQNGSMTVKVYIVDNVPNSLLNGYNAKIDMNSNRALNDLVNNYLPQPTP